MTNFDFLKNEPQFNTFADVAIAAEKVLHIDAASCVLNCRRAMEFAVKWMYSVDGALDKPYQDSLSVLMGTADFRDIVDKDVYERMVFIRKAGNHAAHNPKAIKQVTKSKKWKRFSRQSSACSRLIALGLWAA